MKIIGSVYANPSDADQPIVYVPADGSNAELILINEMPVEAATELSEGADILGLAPLGLIVDMTGGN